MVMAPLLVFWNPLCAQHDEHAAHSLMAPDRLRQVVAAVQAVPGIELRSSPCAGLDVFLRGHDNRYLQTLLEPSRAGGQTVLKLDNDTFVNAHTWQALQYSAGGLCAAVNALLDQETKYAFNVGYAGHHAHSGHGEGFCFTNQTVLAVRYAQELGISRIAVLDFDTHAGNGTIAALMDEPHVLFAETYQKGYPGNVGFRGFRPAHILRERVNRASEFRKAWVKLLDSVSQFGPEIVLVSAGFDGHLEDPLGLPRLTDEDYAWMGSALRGLGVPLAATLEGGYSVTATARCAALFVAELSA
jgi:acetoin utilization deacetylase AcuC-like enzyme